MGSTRIVVVIVLFCGAVSAPVFGQENALTGLPEVRGSFTLAAVHDLLTGRNAFEYDGKTVPPLIRVSGGGMIFVRYVNNLPEHSDEACAAGPCTNTSNLHFHGPHVSPEQPQDDVLTMMSMPGETLNYKVVRLIDSPNRSVRGNLGVDKAGPDGNKPAFL